MKNGRLNFRFLAPALACAAALLLSSPLSAREYTPENPFILKMTSFAMPTHPVVKGGFNPWAEELKELSGGRLVLELYNPNTLCPDADVYDCVKSGVLDLGAQVTQRVKGTFPLSNVIDLPFIYPNAEVASAVFNKLLAEFPEMAAEYNESKLFGAWSGAPFQLHSVKTPIKTIDDVRGMKVGAISASIIPIIQSLGAAGVSVPMSDCYLAIQRGQVDVMAAPYAFVVSTKIYEATKYSTTINLIGNGVYMTMNKNVYEAMPADLCKILDDTLTPERFRKWGQVTDEGARNDLVVMKDSGQQFFDLPESEILKGRELTSSVVEDWFKECDRRKRGDAARAIYARALELSAQISTEMGL